jgi:hypothetical protein
VWGAVSGRGRQYEYRRRTGGVGLKGEGNRGLSKERWLRKQAVLVFCIVWWTEFATLYFLVFGLVGEATMQSDILDRL